MAEGIPSTLIAEHSTREGRRARFGVAGGESHEAPAHGKVEDPPTGPRLPDRLLLYTLRTATRPSPKCTSGSEPAATLIAPLDAGGRLLRLTGRRWWTDDRADPRHRPHPRLRRRRPACRLDWPRATADLEGLRRPSFVNPLFIAVAMGVLLGDYVSAGLASSTGSSYPRLHRARLLAAVDADRLRRDHLPRDGMIKGRRPTSG